MLTKNTYPYEFLARWVDGKLTGAHVGFVTQILEDGKVLSTQTGDVMPVDIGAGKGFPLASILTQLHTNAITRGDTAVAELAVAKKELETEKQNSKAVQTELDQLKAAAIVPVDAAPGKPVDPAPGKPPK